MRTPLVVVGAGGFGRETIDVVRAIDVVRPGHWDLVGVVDDAPSAVNLLRLSALGVAYLGSIGEVLSRRPDDLHAAIGVGAPRSRADVASCLSAEGMPFADLIHPSAVVGSAFVHGPGAVVCAGVSVGTNVSIGAHVHLNPRAVIGHDAVLGDYVSINPGAMISGECRVGPRTLVGAGAVVLQGLEVGPDVVVGAAACVTGDVSGATTVKGVPAR